MRTCINVYMFVHECVYVLVFVYGWRIHICVICVQINDRVCSAIDDLFTFHVVLLRVVCSWLCLMGWWAACLSACLCVWNTISYLSLCLSLCVCGSVCQRYVHMQMLLEFQWGISSYRSCELSIMYALTHRFGTIYLTTIAMWQNYNAFAEKHDYACYIYMMGSEPPGITYPYLLPTHIHKY